MHVIYITSRLYCSDSCADAGYHELDHDIRYVGCSGCCITVYHLDVSVRH